MLTEIELEEIGIDDQGIYVNYKQGVLPCSIYFQGEEFLDKFEERIVELFYDLQKHIENFHS